MSEHHQYFYGTDPTNPLHPSHEKFLESKITGSYRVICGHCGVSLMGKLTDPPGPITEVVWTHDGSSWFGTFSVRSH